jgi:hypothetical protein
MKRPHSRAAKSKKGALSGATSARRQARAPLRGKRKV